MTTLKIETTQGTISLNLFDSVAPKTCENFITHAKNGYYDGIIFHRVIE
jgi:cyclophilin family peptidyl-prolyl cis-trans isomerase